jgi:hypothetical protein
MVGKDKSKVPSQGKVPANIVKKIAPIEFVRLARTARLRSRDRADSGSEYFAEGKAKKNQRILRSSRIAPHTLPGMRIRVSGKVKPYDGFAYCAI